MKSIVAALVLATLASPATAVVLDTFDRAHAGTLGSGCTQQVGASSIVGNEAAGSSGQL